MVSHARIHRFYTDTPLTYPLILVNPISFDQIEYSKSFISITLLTDKAEIIFPVSPMHKLTLLVEQRRHPEPYNSVMFWHNGEKKNTNKILIYCDIASSLEHWLHAWKASMQAWRHVASPSPFVVRCWPINQSQSAWKSHANRTQTHTNSNASVAKIVDCVRLYLISSNFNHKMKLLPNRTLSNLKYLIILELI